jgi:tetratricopeptide (TPR) repeat protein
MIRASIAIALLAGACGAYGFYGTSSPRGLQRAQATSLVPAEIGPRAKEGVQARKLSARIWAEEDFQRATLDWQVRLHRQIERTNEVLRAVLGVELDIVQVKTWPHQGRLTSLSSAMFDLEEIDKGDNVDLVIGLLTPLPVATSAIHELGRAVPLGKHMVLRGSDDAEEARLLAEYYDKLKDEEREKLYLSRQRHKEEAVLLHELGHLFGAIHVGLPKSLMQPSYDHLNSGFSPIDVDIMKLGLEERDAPKKTKLIAYLEQSTFDSFVGNERVNMLALLTGDPANLARASDADIAEVTEEHQPAHDPREVPPPPDPLRDAARLASQGKDREAWLLLEPMLAKQPEQAQVVNLSCGVTARLETSSVAEPLCEKAMALLPDDPAPALYLAYLHVEADRDAWTMLSEAEQRLQKSERSPPDAWAFLARLHQRALSPTAAEIAAAKAEGTDEAISIPEWARQLRDDFGLAPGAIAPRRESDYLKKRNAMNEMVRKRRDADALKLASELAAEFPGTPGADSTACRILVSQRANAKALRYCLSAIDIEPKSIQNRILVAYAAFGAQKPKLAVPHLQRALELDPKKKDVWSLLAAAYQATGDRQRLAELRGNYLQRFGEKLR